MSSPLDSAREAIESTRHEIERYAENMGISSPYRERQREGPVSVVDLTEHLTRHPFKEYRTRALNQITHVIVHHSAGDLDFTTGSDELNVRHIATIHVTGGDAPGILYHRVIGRDGTIFKTQKLDAALGHTEGMDDSSVGVCVIGDYEREQVKTIIGVALAMVLQEATIKSGRQVKLAPHSQFFDAPSGCPGKELRRILPNVRELAENSRGVGEHGKSTGSTSVDPIREKLNEARDWLEKALAINPQEQPKEIQKALTQVRLNLDTAYERVNELVDRKE